MDQVKVKVEKDRNVDQSAETEREGNMRRRNIIHI